MFAVLKPIGTLLLLPVAGVAPGTFGRGVALALVLSALGDAALHAKHHRVWFLAGMGCFMLAHGAYAVAFLLGGGSAPAASTAVVMVVGGALVVGLLRHLWPGIHAVLKLPCAIYGGIIVAMVTSASTLLAGPWPPATALAALGGAVLFYLGDVALALALFGKPYPRAQLVSMGLYWAGQLGIAVAARLQAGGF